LADRPEIEPYETGMLDVGEGHRLHWELCGNPAGQPAVAFHGGPGSGCTPVWRRHFDPEAYWAHGIYREVVAPERLVFTTAWEHPEGSPKHETVVTITLTEKGGRTKLHFHQAIFDSTTARDLHRGGWSSTFDMLADYLAAL
jgi:hypothetical protein